MPGELIRFGPFTFEPVRQILWRDGRAVPLGRRAAGLLGVLLRAEGRVVTKSELLDAAWPDVTVEESNLSVQMTALRRSLGARDDGEPWIGTMPRVGYRLERPDPNRAAVRGALDGKIACAVLPFAAIGGDPQEEQIAAGLADDLTTDLSRIPGLLVIARSSASASARSGRSVAEIARELDVRYVVQGSIRRAGTRLRINAQLIDASGVVHVWSDRLDGHTGDIFGLQDAIAGSIVRAIKNGVLDPVPAPVRRPASMEAHELFRRGRAAVAEWSDFPRAGREYLEAAIALEPTHAAAHAWLAHSHHFEWLVGDDDDPAALGLGREAAQRAVALDPGDPDARWSLGLALAYGAGDLEAAQAEVREALRLNPNHSDAWVFLADLACFLGDPREGLAYLANAFRLNPHPPALYRWHLGYVQYAAGNYADAAETLGNHIAQLGGSRRILAASLSRLGRVDEARAEAATFLAAHPRFSVARWAAKHPFRHAADRDRFVEGYRLAGLPG